MRDLLQVLRDGQLQSWRHWGIKAQGRDAAGGGRHRCVQEGESYHVRLGDQGPAPQRGDLQSG